MEATVLDLIDAKMGNIIKSGRARILAVETSCDETAAAVVDNGREIVSNVVYSQVALHAVYGGVVPEIASRNHVAKIDVVVDEALERANCAASDIDAVAVTYGPGLVGALLTGVSWAKAAAYALGLPLVGVHHIEGHISANFLAYRELSPPFICLIASGGHSHFAKVADFGVYELLGRTLDDAAGEAFDKVARVLGLPYPGGPALDKLAKEGDPYAITFPRVRAQNPMDVSFSGIKTFVINALNSAKQRGDSINPADFAAGFQRTVVDALVSRTILAARECGINTIAAAGGVAANSLLRSELAKKADEAGLRLFLPPIELCTDNAAMIAGAAFYRLMRGEIADLSLNAVPYLPLIQ